MRFVVICAARTGSSHFVSVLSGHPDLFVNGNIFDGRKQKRLHVFWPKEDMTAERRAELIKLRDENPEEFLERVCEAAYGRPHIGFKIFSRENDRMLDILIEDASVRKVILYRRNVLASFSSFLVALKTGQYDLRDSEKKKETPLVKFNGPKFIRYHNRYAGFFRDAIEKLNAANQVFHFVNYEDINNPGVLSNVVAFLGADPSKGISRDAQFKRQIKQNSSDILSRFSNPKAVEKFLRRHGLLHWSHEGELDLEDLRPGGSVESAPEQLASA